MRMYFFSRLLCISVLLIASCSGVTVAAQTSGGALPVASAVFVSGTTYPEGEVVVFSEETQTYSVSSKSNQSGVFGVTTEKPALVFETATDTVPVVSEGVTTVLVATQASHVVRGDVLTTSQERGRVRVAGVNDAHVFAVALEDMNVAERSVLVEVSHTKAEALWKEKWQPRATSSDTVLETDTESDTQSPVSSQVVRIGIALALAVIALSFILYTFRSTLAKAVVSIGRNPRARSSIMMLSFGNIIFALVLCAVVLFVAVAVLVLPIA